MTGLFVRVALDHPLPALYDYRYPADAAPPSPGMLVRVPFGRRDAVGLICEVTAHSDVPAERLKSVEAVCTACPPLSEPWLALAAFAADYYQRGLGEVALPALPQALRDPSRWARLLAPQERYRLLAAGRDALPDALPARAQALRRLAAALVETGELDLADARALHPKAVATLDAWREAGWVEHRVIEFGAAAGSPAANAAGAADDADGIAVSVPTLSDEQADAVEAIAAARGFAPFLLHGVTGSGKTEVYLRALARLLDREPDAQALVLVPEINLTPQFEAAFRARFASLADDTIVTLHSGLAEGERARSWLAAHTGRARIVLGTRLAVLASLPRLAMIVVDEEHDPAYKQQEGLRYSARDLAVWRAKQLGLPVVLGSATPSLESWWQSEQGRYRRLTLSRRAVADAVLPAVRLIDLEEERRRGRASFEGLSGPLVAALKARVERGEQSLVFLNRRGYAPVLSCDACGWVAGCPRCSAYVVLHKPERTLRCHHCGWESRIPRACPDCGNVDIAPMGRGTQRVEEALATAVPGARVLRIDADSTRRKGSAQALFSDVHAGEVDILVGTQMIAKGHDFQRVSLVGVLNADNALFSHDFRAGERLFAQLMQVSGRAGRAGLPGEVLVQTRYPRHALYHALARHDYIGFANAQLAERRDAHLPPFVYQALLRAEGRTLEAALAFLQQAADALAGIPAAERVTAYDAVPMTIVKVMNVHRAQLLVESASRAALQATLREWQPALRALRGVLRWNLEVDPLDI
ncbi:primosomal protein N' [Paraburkholderia caballeronis]|uniref:Replication restart protein PriA n=1 Tax=Paraburkholderia caballeronis TaxID=416943 RepID=A0A1H7GXT1_9BURK|nr:primosomal protein N' [Paraburkholderia caballeronis]PXW29726.1 replication restart DNA helicase PriA [Paraburkholderia caballeronis]PXX04985.1 replication restart DNA helicase PriA [Paraburkholderia caballeronis]RAK06046.1 replication restart DNA helicase PriA [Paraburkholderia caballeronis]SEB47337.1 replication restart DNA helicase PriA [Paraburkholderia caballeronis]SEK42824.1 replication restart DNA helicase PriA [Paraburkholderia caballeronis]